MITAVKEIVLKSLLDDSETKDTAIKRLSYLLQEVDVDLLVKGVVTNAVITDDDQVLDRFSVKNVFVDNFQVVKVSPLGVVSIRYTYRDKKHFASQELADTYLAGKNAEALSLSQYTEDDIIVPCRYSNDRTIDFSYEDAQNFCKFETL